MRTKQVLVVIFAMALVVLLRLSPKAVDMGNPVILVQPPPEPPDWCEVVHAPAGEMYFTNIVIWPESPACLGTPLSAWPNMGQSCDDAITVIHRTPPNEDIWSTNPLCPYSITNWYELSGPGGLHLSGEGLFVPFTPTNCGQVTVTFHEVWTNSNPCGYTNAMPGGHIVISTNFSVVNAEIAEADKTICVCDTTSFTLTNTCDPVTWEVWPDEPGGPHVLGDTIVAGTNCGTWAVVARSTVKTNCADGASLTVVKVEGLWPDGGTLIGTNPPTYVICPVPTNAPEPYLTVTASFCPWMEETNRPPCWQMSGGLGTNRTSRQVDRRQLGSTTISVTAGCSSQTAVIVVQDTNPPILYCYDLGFCTDEGECYATVYLTNHIGATDDCGPVTPVFSPPGPQFDKGTNSVTATVTDVAGNTTNCTFDVIVSDCEAPEITCSSNLVVCASPSGTNVVTWPDPVATDNCAVTNVTCNPTNGSDFPVGETAVVCTATDSSGNQGYCWFTVTVLQREVKSVEFLTDHGLLTDNTTNYTYGGTTYPTPEWVRKPLRNCPISHTKNTNITVCVTVAVTPANVDFTLAGDGGFAYLSFPTTNLTSTGSDQAVTLTANAPLPNCVTNITGGINWTITTSDSACKSNAWTSGPHRIYVTYATPTGTEATEKRISWVCSLANGKATLAEIGDAIGPDATSHARFDPNKSIFGNPAMLTEWSVMDGTNADCGTLSTLMKSELDLVGALGSAVKYVYSRHDSWDRLVTDNPSFGDMEHRVPGNDATRLGFISGGWNNYEGCCLFQSKYWMGGAGAAEAKAVDVLHHWVDPNTSATGNHQCYWDQPSQVVAYPPPPEPTY